MVTAVAPVGETFTISTDLLKAKISAQGGDLVELELIKYRDHDNKDKTLSCLMPNINTSHKVV